MIPASEQHLRFELKFDIPLIAQHYRLVFSDWLNENHCHQLMRDTSIEQHTKTVMSDGLVNV